MSSLCMQSAADEALSAALEVRVGARTTETAADELAARSVPFVFDTGQAPSGQEAFVGITQYQDA